MHAQTQVFILVHIPFFPLKILPIKSLKYRTLRLVAVPKKKITIAHQKKLKKKKLVDVHGKQRLRMCGLSKYHEKQLQTERHTSSFSVGDLSLSNCVSWTGTSANI